MTAAAVPIAGLTEEEAAARQARGEGNTFSLPTSRTYLRILRDNAFTFVNVVLFSIAALLLAMGLFGDAVVTAALVLFNVIVGVVEESRAKRKLDKIALLVRPMATVVRDAKERVIDPSELVVGDAIVVRPGDQVLVDGEVTSDSRLEIDESLLTGESDAVQKGKGDTLYSGTFCMAGEAIYEARNVGGESVANQLSASVRSFRKTKTPLQRGIDVILRIALVAAALIGLLVASQNFLGEQQVQLREGVRAAAVIVALVPQGLASMVIVSYSLAAVRMAGKGILVQRSNSIESLSNVDILCLDKTGTLTSNKIQFDAMLPLCLESDELGRRIGAFAASVSGANRTIEAIQEAFPAQPRQVREEIAFSSERKWSGVIFTDVDLAGLHVLGAPEVLKPFVNGAGDLDAQIAEWADQGLRVLLFAYRPDVTSGVAGPDGPALPSGLLAAGLVCLSDELRPEAKSTLTGFAEAGIHLKIISGDNPQTVAALARQAGFGGELVVASGLDLAAMDESDLARAAEDVTVFGRITPQQKETLINALRKSGAYVAMIGDGVNDVLALKRSHLAIALESGSQAARSVADIVLLRDSFGSLPACFREGQRVIRGMHRVMRLFLARTLYVTLIIGGAAVVQAAFPVTPRQSGVLALLTVGIPALALTSWAKPGTPPQDAVRSLCHFVIPAGLTATTFLLPLYLGYIFLGDDVERARTVLTAAAVLCGLLLILFVEPPSPFFVGGEQLNGSLRPLFLAGAMLVLFIAAMAVPTLRVAFELAPLRVLDVIVIELAAIAFFVTVRWVWRARVFERFFGLDPE
jgi:cation-transporting ATPase E